MKTLWIRVRAPFASFPWMQGGSYRATAPVMPPSAAWGFLLNLAGIEIRSPGNTTTLINLDAPPLDLAVGSLSPLNVGVFLQHYHSYGTSKEFKEGCKGNKYHISPVKKEVLIGFDCVLGVRGSDEILNRVVKGVKGEIEETYGVPFAGDNSCMISRIDLLSDPPDACWYVPIGEEFSSQQKSCRLSIGMDRVKIQKTKYMIFTPTLPKQPPQEVWVTVPQLQP